MNERCKAHDRLNCYVSSCKDDNAGQVGINTGGDLAIGIGSGLTIDTDGDLGIQIAPGVSIDLSGD